MSQEIPAFERTRLSVDSAFERTRLSVDSAFERTRLSASNFEVYIYQLLKVAANDTTTLH